MPKFVLRINSVTVLSSFLSKKFEIIDMCPYLQALPNLEGEFGGEGCCLVLLCFHCLSSLNNRTMLRMDQEHFLTQNKTPCIP